MVTNLNVINSFLAYRDGATNDNPSLRSFDITRKMFSISVQNPSSETKTIAPGASLTLFDGTSPSLLDNTSVLSLQLLPGQTSLYRLSVTAGAAGFRTPRSISGLGQVVVTVNNNALATFNFGSAVLSGVQVGDVLRVAGQLQNDTGPFAFNPLNAGLWTVVGISGSVVSCVRPVDQSFSGASETVASPGVSDIQIYSSSGVQEGSKLRISGTFSPVSQRTYVVQAVTPSTVDIMSANPLPNESVLSYVANSIVFYTSSKRFVYMEFDQDAVVRYNGDSGDNNVLNPVVAGDQSLVGFTSKWGETYQAVVVNKSINPLTLSYYLAE